MRKHVKILVSVIAVLCMVVGAAIPAFAADNGKITVSGDWNESAVDDNGVKTVTLDNGKVSWAGLGDMGVQVRDGRTDAIGLGPVTKVDNVDLDAATIAENAKNAYIDFVVNVDKAGTYTLTLAYSAGSVSGENKRVADVKVNDGERVHLDVKDHPSWNTEDDDTATFTAHLNKGENHITFVNVEGFDDGKDGGTTHAKAINVIGLEWTLKEADKVDENPGDEGNKGDEDNKGDKPGDETAGKTGFATIALAVAALGSGAVVVSKRRHH